MFGMTGTMGILIVGSVYDLKSRRIPKWLLLTGGVLAMTGLLINGVLSGFRVSLWEGAMSLLPGIGLMVLSRLTEKKVGMGDGILLVLLGLFEGSSKVFAVFCLGLFLQSIMAVVLLLLKKADKQTCIPFAPFLLLARILLLFG